MNLQGSSKVEYAPVKRDVVGSNPTPGARSCKRGVEPRFAGSRVSAEFVRFLSCDCLQLLASVAQLDRATAF